MRNRGKISAPNDSARERAVKREKSVGSACGIELICCVRCLEERLMTTSPSIDAGAQESLVTWTNVIYLLHAFSLLTGILGAATVIGAFLIGWPSIIAVILNYVKRDEARGTWLESHFRWQIRTFWFGLLWVSMCMLFTIMTLGLGI